MSAERGEQREERRGERLQKVLAHAGVASRRKSEEYMLQGWVKVNGEVVTELGTRVRPGVDRITFDGKPVEVEQERLYYALYKPVGYISTANDPPMGGPWSWTWPRRRSASIQWDGWIWTARACCC